MPVHVDGEPWIQSPGEVVVLKSALKVYFTLSKLQSGPMLTCLYFVTITGNDASSN